MAIDPATTRDLYGRFAPAWRANRDFAELHEHVLRDGTYLRPFGKGGKGQEGVARNRRRWRRAQCRACGQWSKVIDDSRL